MATNNITSGKVPRTRSKSTARADMDMATFVDDPIVVHENQAGERGRLADIQAQTMDDISDAERAELFQASGLKIPKRPMF